jgi:hypothetical protein
MYGLWVIGGMGYGHKNYLSTKLVDPKSYGLLEVMGYYSMGYLRFDCNSKKFLFFWLIILFKE